MRCRIECLSAAVAITLTSFAVPAIGDDDLDYTFAELNLLARDIDAFDDNASVIEDWDDGGGFAFRGSYAFTDNLFVFGGYSRTESDVTFASPDVFPIPFDEDVRRLDVGLGLNRGINENADFVGRLGYTDIDFGDFDLGASDAGNIGDLNDDASDGYFVDVGVRSQLTEMIEGGIGVRYLNIQAIDDTSLVGSLSFELSPSWGVITEIDAGDEVASFGIGARYRWEP